MWKDSLFRGFSYIAESVGEAFSIIPREQYPRCVKVFFCCAVEWEAYFFCIAVFGDRRLKTSGGVMMLGIGGVVDI